MHPAYIQAELKKRGYTSAAIARECGVSNPTVHQSIYGKPYPSPKVRKLIAEILDMEVDELWPEKKQYVVLV